MNSPSVQHLLGATRAAVGLSALVAPAWAARAAGMDPDRSTGFMTRLFGSRDLLLGGWLFTAPPSEARTAAAIGVAIDAIDVVSSSVEWRSGRLSTWGTVFGGGGAAAFVVLGVLTARGAARAG